MIQIKIKNLFYGLLLLSSLQFAQCKSKAKEKDVNSTTTPIDTSATTSSAPAPVEISPDETLQTGLKDATKDFPGVKTTVSNGEITLTGNITRDKLPTLMQSLNSLHPKKINNNLTIK